MRSIFLIIIIIASIGTFVAYVKPQYEMARAMKKEINLSVSSLETAEKLKTSREELIEKYNAIPKTDLDNLKTLLPDSVDNIRLIIQIDSLASRNGLSTVRNVEYQTLSKTGALDASTQNQSPESLRKPYGEFVISFQTTGQYKNFLSFLSDLEANLRIVDVTSIVFQPLSGVQSLAGNMSYQVTLKTYWLKQ